MEKEKTATTGNQLKPDIEVMHPGVMIKNELIKRGITQKQFAIATHFTPSVLNEVFNGKRPLSVETALLIGAALRINPDIWIKQQTLYDKARLARDPQFQDRLALIKSRSTTLK